MSETTTGAAAQERCELTDLEKSSCDHCRAQAKNVPWFTAQFDGACAHPACHVEIAPGDRIYERPDGTYEHARCAKRTR